MHTERDVTRIVQSWLRTDEHECADRVLDDVLARLDATPQRRSWWPSRRSADMNTYAKLAIAAAAVVVVAVVGINLLPASGGVGGGPAVSPSPSPSPTLLPIDIDSAGVYPTGNRIPQGDLPIGRHSLAVEGVPFFFNVSTQGWERFGSISLNKSTRGPQGAEAIIYWTGFPDGIYADPCSNLLNPPVGPSAADLAAAVSTAPGTELVTGPSDVTVGARAAKHVVLTVREDVGCDPGFFYTWKDAEVGALWTMTGVGDTIRVWIVEVDGTRLFIAGETNADAGPELEHEIAQIVDSIVFE